MINISEIQPLDLMSEVAHYQVVTVNTSDVKLKHLESGNEVSLSHKYVSELLKTADQYSKEIKIGKEDKFWTAKQLEDAKKKGEDVSAIQVGDLRLKGFKSLWNDIHSTQVFTVCFKKKDKPYSAKKLAELQDAQIKSAIDAIEKASKAKKGVLEEAKKELVRLQTNPILPYELGEERILRGYKIQFTSEDGHFDCVDVDITEKNNIRPVNVNSILFLVFDDVKYILE